jgi:hypothetical protein
MAADYDAPRNIPDGDGDDTLQSLAARAPQSTGLVADLDDGDASGGFQLGSTEIDEATDVIVLPMQEHEFTCIECFLVRPRVQLDHETTLGPVCIECAF